SSTTRRRRNEADPLAWNIPPLPLKTRNSTFQMRTAPLYCGIMSERIQDLPSGERPREKLSRLGPGSLDNAELMALFISTGTKGRSAIAIGRDLLRKYGSMTALGGMPVSELAKEKGLGLA